MVLQFCQLEEEAYLQPFQTSLMEFFCVTANGQSLKAFNNFSEKNSTIDTRQGLRYAPGNYLTRMSGGSSFRNLGET